MVTNVDPDGVAAEHGFTTGDVILEVAGKTVATPGRRPRRRSPAPSKDGKRTRADAGEVRREHAVRRSCRLGHA